MSYDTIYPPMARSPETELDGAINSSQTSIPLKDATKLPAPPNVFTIDPEGDASETCLYTGITANLVTGITRGFDPPGSAKGWAADTTVARVLTQQDMLALYNLIDTHQDNVANPHAVTKSQVGLNAAENKSANTIRTETGPLRCQIATEFPSHADGLLVLRQDLGTLFISIDGVWEEIALNIIY